jgi:hypothetical protein
MLPSKQEILAAVRRHAETDLAWDGEQLTIIDVYILYEGDLKIGDVTVMVKWIRSDVAVKTDDAI